MEYSKRSILMCSPQYFDVIYEINPWMDINSRPDQQVAQNQWKNLHKAIRSVGGEIHLLPPAEKMPDLVFTANAALVKGKKVVLAKMKTSERQPEEQHNLAWFKEHNFTIKTLSTAFEGEGDAFIVDNKLIYGHGFRSDLKSAETICEFLELDDIVSCKLTNPYFYHLDTCFAPLYHDNKALIHPEAIHKTSLKELEKIFDLIAVHENDALRFACNAVPIHKHVILPASCQQTHQQLEDHGFEPHGVELFQFMKAGGSAKCLTLRLNN